MLLKAMCVCLYYLHRAALTGWPLKTHTNLSATKHGEASRDMLYVCVRMLISVYVLCLELFVVVKP